MSGDRKRGEKAPVRRPGTDEEDDSGWAGEPAEDAERQRGEGRGLDEPEKQPPPPDIKELKE